MNLMSFRLDQYMTLYYEDAIFFFLCLGMRFIFFLSNLEIQTEFMQSLEK